MIVIEPKKFKKKMEINNYNSSWGYACKDAGYMPDECEGFKNNPVDILRSRSTSTRK